jgi:hypothetical protein
VQAAELAEDLALALARDSPGPAAVLSASPVGWSFGSRHPGDRQEGPSSIAAMDLELALERKVAQHLARAEVFVVVLGVLLEEGRQGLETLPQVW